MRSLLENEKRRQIAGWIAVVFSTAVTSFWAFWGIIENFHEGWYYDSWLSNVGLMLVQYLGPMLIFINSTYQCLADASSRQQSPAVVCRFEY